MKIPTIILGAGGHSSVLIDALKQIKVTILGITVPINNENSNEYCGVPILGNDDIINNYHTEKIRLINGIGSIKQPTARALIYIKYKELGYKFSTIIHPTAIVSSSVKLGEGVQIMAGAIIQTGSEIGENTIINTKASVDHACRIGANVHIAPGVTISGDVNIGNNVHIGTGAVIIQGISIEDNCVIGAGSVVINNVPKSSTVFGVPAKIKGET